MESISTGKKLKEALIKSISGRYIVYAVQVVSMMILARIFTPEVFGIFAVVQVFAVFFALFSEMGLGPAIINESKIPVAMRDGLFTVTLFLGLLVAIVFFLGSPLISWFYDNSIYSTLVLPVAASVVFNAMLIVPLASLQKDRKFISIARAEALAEVGSLVTVVCLIPYIDSIWALAVKPLVASILKFVFLWLESKRTIIGRPAFGRELWHIQKLIGFSAYQTGFNFLNYFSRNLDNILVGKFFGAVSLGVYDKAYQLMRYPLMLLTFAMTPAIQPVLTEIKHDKYEFERLHNKFVRYMSLLGLGVSVAVYVLADLIVKVVLGSQWGMVIPLLEILSITIPIQIVLSSSGGFYQAAGRVDLHFKCGLFSSITNVSAIIFGIYEGSLEALCWLIVLSFSVNIIQCYYVMGKYLFPNGYFGVLKSIGFGVSGAWLLAIWILLF